MPLSGGYFYPDVYNAEAPEHKDKHKHHHSGSHSSGSQQSDSHKQ